MRQSDGADLVGENDPRRSDIGIIYVAPGDDRQSVLTAILTQEDLARKQILLVLPDRNSALRRPLDFDGLKDMRGELQAQLVVVASDGSSLAEYARQRRFAVYPSLEAFAQTLRDEDQSPQASRQEGRLKGRKPKRATPEVASPPATPAPSPEPEETSPPAPSLPPQMDAAAPAYPQSTPAPGDDDDRAIEFPLMPPMTPSPSESETEPEEESSAPRSPDALPGAGSSATGEEEDKEDEEDEDRIILIPPPAPVDPVHNYPVPVTNAPPARTGGGYPAAYSQQRSRRRWLVAGAVVLLLLVIGFFAYQPLRDLIFVPSATVTITPASKELEQTYQLTAIPGDANPTQRQVQARLLYAASGSQSKTVSATGVGITPGVQATGFLVFYNSSTTIQTIPAGTVMTDANGVQIVNDSNVSIPAAIPPVQGNVAAAAHAVQPGSSGNISPNDFNYVPVSCCSGQVFVQNILAFTGGVDQQSYPYVQQSDIDNATNALASSLTSTTRVMLMKQLLTGERLVDDPQCAPGVDSDHQAGEQAASVTVSATVVCTGEVYNQQDALALAANLLKNDAVNNPGAAFVPVGNIITTVQQATMGSKGTVALRVFAEGIWVYQFDSSQTQAMRKLIVGKNQDDARSQLMRVSGVDETHIQLYGGNGTTLPTDINHIMLAVLNVPGLQVKTSPVGG